MNQLKDIMVEGAMMIEKQGEQIGKLTKKKKYVRLDTYEY